ncbi:MAG: Ig-like domain-containing protein [Acidimicrobiia bacterium]|nr:Ig-like domain-containing protein [Acidimicrobiia bacterium]
MLGALRLFLVLLLAATGLAVVPGEAASTVPGGVGRIIFLGDHEEANGEIYIRDFAGSQPTRLTTNTDREDFPRWSPDGTRIAFSRLVGSRVDVYTMDPNGSNEVNLTSSLTGPSHPLDWSPDGTRILIRSAHGGNSDLWVMSADGSNPQQLTFTVEVEWTAAWSPDGSTIAFSKLVGGTTDIFLMNADGSNPRNITSARTTVSDGNPAWSPGGDKIAFTSGLGTALEVWAMGADGSNPVNLTNSPTTRDSGPAWSADGLKIAFVSNRDGDDDLWTMNPDGSGAAQLTNIPSSQWQVDWESVNRNPMVVDDEAFVHRGQAVEVAVLANDTEPDGEPMTLRDITRMPAEGSVVINPSGTVTYTHNGVVAPPGHAVPYTDSFDYEVEDARLGSNTGTVRVEIYPYFDDVPMSNAFFEDVLWLATQRVTQGCNPPENTLFCPHSFVTRGQMAAFLVRARGYTAGVGADLFVDDDDSVFETVIDQLGTAGVTRGCNPPLNDRFCPTHHVTRGQMAAFLVRAFGLPDLGMHDLFVDDDESIFRFDIDKLGATGVSRGCNPPENDRFCPDAYVTRQQMAAFIQRAVTWGQE